MKRLALLALLLLAVTDLQTFVGNHVVFEHYGSWVIREEDGFVAISSSEAVFSKNADHLDHNDFMIFVFNPVSDTIENVEQMITMSGYEMDNSNTKFRFSAHYSISAHHERLFLFKSLPDDKLEVAVFFTPIGEMKPKLFEWLFDSITLRLGKLS